MHTMCSSQAAYFVGQIALLRRVALGAVFEKYFAIQRAGGAGGEKAAVINYRPGESIWVAAQKDRVTVIFSTPFKDEDDVILGKIFLQVCACTCKSARQPVWLTRHAMSPRVIFGPGVQGGPQGCEHGAASAVCLPRRAQGAGRDQRAHRRQHGLRHLWCAAVHGCSTHACSDLCAPHHGEVPAQDDRSHPQLPQLSALPHQVLEGVPAQVQCTLRGPSVTRRSRMRAKTTQFLQVLNRARPDSDVKEKKTARSEYRALRRRSRAQRQDLCAEGAGAGAAAQDVPQARTGQLSLICLHLWRGI